MAGYQFPDHERDPVYLVRTIGRLAQMLIEMRDEYISEPREDTLDQIERRLVELSSLQEQLRELRSQGISVNETSEPTA